MSHHPADVSRWCRSRALEGSTTLAGSSVLSACRTQVVTDGIGTVGDAGLVGRHQNNSECGLHVKIESRAVLLFDYSRASHNRATEYRYNTNFPETVIHAERDLFVSHAIPFSHVEVCCRTSRSGWFTIETHAAVLSRPTARSVSCRGPTPAACRSPDLSCPSRPTAHRLVAAPPQQLVEAHVPPYCRSPDPAYCRSPHFSCLSKLTLPVMSTPTSQLTVEHNFLMKYNNCY